MFHNITEPQPVVCLREKYPEKTSENVWRERDKTSIFASAFRKGGGFWKESVLWNGWYSKQSSSTRKSPPTPQGDERGIDKEDTSDRQYIWMIDYGKGVLGLKGGLLEEINKKTILQW